MSGGIQVPLLHDAVTDHIADLIVRGELRPGARLYELELCDRLGVSRSPVREALRSLANQGLVTLEPRRGASVSPVDASEAIQLYEARLFIQPEVVRLATPLIDDTHLDRLRTVLGRMEEDAAERRLYDYLSRVGEFRAVVDAACPNAVLVDLVEHMWKRALRFRSLSIRQPDRVPESLQIHRRLFEALEARDITATVALTRQLLSESHAAIQAVLADEESGAESPAP